MVFRIALLTQALEGLACCLPNARPHEKCGFHSLCANDWVGGGSLGVDGQSGLNEGKIPFDHLLTLAMPWWKRSVKFSKGCLHHPHPAGNFPSDLSTPTHAPKPDPGT
mmetsp:Transcript_61457/g.109520  ORF Transcript_61457/g.109520 Transcript_61457/m.109520 type:complete len:108 (-) Transcript_61457:297-620(-)